MENTINKNIENFCDEMLVCIENFRLSQIIECEANKTKERKAKGFKSDECQNNDIVQNTIKEVIEDLEETKKSFKSKKIKEVREKLMKIIER